MTGGYSKVGSPKPCEWVLRWSVGQDVSVGFGDMFVMVESDGVSNIEAPMLVELFCGCFAAIPLPDMIRAFTLSYMQGGPDFFLK